MKNTNNIFVLTFLVILAAGVVSAAWPLTGYSTYVDEVDHSGRPNYCADTDEGKRALVAGGVWVRRWFRANKAYVDKCLDDGKLREYYCLGARISYKDIGENELGPGKCVDGYAIEIEDFRGETRVGYTAARWESVEDSCEVTSDGIVIDQYGTKYASKCARERTRGLVYVTYGCEGNKVTKDYEECSSKCKEDFGGCYAVGCNKEGTILTWVKGDQEMVFEDKCIEGDKAVKEFFCREDGSVKSRTVKCDLDTSCIEGKCQGAIKIEDPKGIAHRVELLERKYKVLLDLVCNKLGISHELCEKSDDTTYGRAKDFYVVEGESTTVEYNGKAYEVFIRFISNAKVELEVNGGEISTSLSDGEAYQMYTGDVISVKEILFSEKDTDLSKVRLAIGSDPLLGDQPDYDLKEFYLKEGESTEVYGFTVKFVKTMLLGSIGVVHVQVDDGDEIIGSIGEGGYIGTSSAAGDGYYVGLSKIVTGEEDKLLLVIGDMEDVMNFMEDSFPGENSSDLLTEKTFWIGEGYSETIAIKDGDDNSVEVEFRDYDSTSDGDIFLFKIDGLWTDYMEVGDHHITSENMKIYLLEDKDGEVQEAKVKLRYVG